MGIRKRGKRWIVDVRDGKGRRIRRSVGTSKAVAELTEKDLHLKIAYSGDSGRRFRWNPAT